MQHVGTKTMTTPRLTLRRFALADAPAMYRNWAGDPQVTLYMPWETHPDMGATLEVLERWAPQYAQPDFYHWAIVFEGEAIGSISLHNIKDSQQRCEMGYCIGRRWWNRGIVTEAAAAVVGYIFTRTAMHRVGALHNVSNIGSGRVMEKIGMTREGTLREHTVDKEGRRGDTNIWGILRPEWEAGKAGDGPIR